MVVQQHAELVRKVDNLSLDVSVGALMGSEWCISACGEGRC